MDFWSSAEGMLELELTTADAENVFAAFGAAGIEVKNLCQISELTYRCAVRRKCWTEVSEICAHRDAMLQLRRKKGIYWNLKQMLSRPFLVFGTLSLLMIIFWLPTRVLFVCVEGNARIPDKMILDAAEKCGIGFGSSRRKVRSEKVKNALLDEIPELQWAGVNTNGCVATISVREKAEPPIFQKNTIPGNITALRDGFILSCTVTKGTPQVTVGQTVREGQTLVSAYTDCGFCIRAEQAEGEILAQTSRALEAVLPVQYVKKESADAIKRKYSILIRKKRIFLWKDSGISEASCGRMYEEYFVTLPGGFQLPVALCVESYACGNTRTEEVPEADAKAQLKAYVEQYLRTHMVAGEILQDAEMVTREDDVYRLRGDYTCSEMIGKIQQERIGDTNGKDS